MWRAVGNAATVLLLACAAWGQATLNRPEFLVADIRQNKSGDLEYKGGILPGGQLGVRNVPLKMTISFAYKGTSRLQDTYVTGGPRWVDTDRFDITGKAPPDTADKTLSQMLQVLLEKEFRLKVHEEQKSMNAYALVLRKGAPKLTIAAKAGHPDCLLDGPQGQSVGGRHLACTNISMADFARVLPDDAPGYVDRPVVDLTGLSGSYDFKLDFAPHNNFDSDGSTLSDSLSKLGLRLERRTLPLSVVVIDHIEKLSGEN